MATEVMISEEIRDGKSDYLNGFYPNGYYRFIQQKTEMALATFIARWTGGNWRDISVSVAFTHEALTAAKAGMDAIARALDEGEDAVAPLAAFCGRYGGVSDGVSVTDGAPDELRRLAKIMSSLLGAAAERAASEASGEPLSELKKIP